MQHSEKTKNSTSQNSTVQVQSTATLIKASVIATIVGLIVLVVAILPAEYNIDPTGMGSALGLTQIAQAAQAPSSSKDVISVQTNLDEMIIIDAPSVVEIKQAREQQGVRADVIDIVIPANKGLEYKLLLNEYGHVEYQWKTDGAALYFDFHGEPQGDTTGYYESYSISTSNQVKGSLTTPFSGSHGWYWKNNSGRDITVQLTTKGQYLVKE
ncbi:hypothetical protein L2737_16965 [Shewanella electrodiphila]|uniref:Transmembrane anchor protein n=1 Tax=Shewanella electrodiphila TaxID=934143 RepID=A0ABT0KT10_9GAMM|nr:hypothetical protein [Shewanella electrodiphila]MCL1046992.1 hypothetical protein [Shewanella electrodiphila]